MIKIKKILTFVVLFTSCGLLEEQQETFEGSYYIVEGWSDFEKQEFQSAAINFLDAKQSGDVRDSILSNIGLGITYMYWSNNIINNQVDSTARMEELRQSSGVHLAEAENQYNNSAPSEFIFNEIDFEPVFLLSMILKYNYDVLSNSRSYFEEGLDYEYYEDMLSASEKTLQYSESLIDNDDEFVFIYDESLGINQIYLIRAQTYLRIAEYGSAQSEYLKFGNLDCLDNYGIIQCLSTFE